MIRIEGTNPTDAYTIKTGAVANEDHLAAINADDEVLNAADNAAIKVLGIFYRVDDENNKAEIRDGIFLLKNSVANPLKRNDRGAIAYVEDSETVSSDPGDNSVVAGVVIDVSSEGVFVDTRPSVYIKGDTGTGTPGANGSVPGGIYTDLPLSYHFHSTFDRNLPIRASNSNVFLTCPPCKIHQRLETGKFFFRALMPRCGN